MKKYKSKYIINNDYDFYYRCTCGPILRCPSQRYAQLQLCDSFKAYEAGRVRCSGCEFRCYY